MYFFVEISFGFESHFEVVDLLLFVAKSDCDRLVVLLYLNRPE